MTAKTWQGGSDNWASGNANDWSPSGQPGSGDTVTISQGNPQIESNVGQITALTVNTELDFQTGGILDVTGTATNAGTIDVDYYGNYGGAGFTVGGLLTNYGSLNIGNSGESAAVTTTVGSLQNYTGTSSSTGTINLNGGSSYATVLNVNSAAGFGGTTTGSEIGTVNLTGDAQIDFASGHIGVIRGTLNLTGAEAVISSDGTLTNSALSTLTSVTGQLNVFDGSTITTSASSLTNTGTIGVDPYNYASGTTFTVTNQLINPGTLNIGNSGGSSTGVTTVSLGSLQNYSGSTLGTINLNGGTPNTSNGDTYEALLKIGGAAGFGGTTAGKLVGTVNLNNDAQIQFASGQLSTIAGSLQLNGAESVISNDGTDTNSALTGLTTVSGTLSILAGNTIDATATGGVANTGTLEVDAYNYGGGSNLTIANGLTNSGTVDLGNSGLNTATEISAASLTNIVGSTDGTINLNGGPVNASTGAGAEALLNVGSAAGFGTAGKLIGSVNLSNDAQIDFTSNQINTITSGSELTLNGANAVIANDGTGTNSALTGLTTVSGNLTLLAGATIDPTGSLTNSATIDVDAYDYGGGSSLAVAEGLTNSGTINLGNLGLSTSTSMSAASLANVVGSSNGTINITGSLPNSQTGIADTATLSIGGPAGFGTGGELIGNVNLDQDAQIQFASGQIKTITSGSELTLNGINAAIANDGTDTNSALTGLTTVAGDLYLDGNAEVATGAATGAASTLTVGNTLTDSGYIVTPNLDIAAGGTFELATGGSVYSSTGTGITFAGTTSGTSTLALDAAPPYSGSTFGTTLADFGNDDDLDLKGLTFATGASATYSNGTLTVTSNNVSENFTLSAPGATTFYASKDSSGGTLVTDTPVCFAAGTRIRTVRGEIPVEALCVGDLAITASGETRPIRWIGHRRFDCRRHARPCDAMPIRIAAHAFAENRPARDLYLSPYHSVWADLFGEVLIPVVRLANGATIAQVDVDEVVYWHVELDSHDLILAENLACESYLDMGNRSLFAENGVIDLSPVPDKVWPTHADFCRPFHGAGGLVEFAHERLCARAGQLGWRLAVDDPLGGLWLEVDGRCVAPACDGLVARATMPADAREVWIRSTSGVPAELHGVSDTRRLGLQLASLTIDDGLRCRREIGCGDPRLTDGFHADEGALRWTDGCARIPAEMWVGCRDMFALRLAFAGPALPRWGAPAAATTQIARAA